MRNKWLHKSLVSSCLGCAGKTQQIVCGARAFAVYNSQPGVLDPELLELEND